MLLLRFELRISYWILLKTLQRLVQQSFLLQIVCSNYAFGAASKQNCLRTAYVMSPTNDDIVEFARIGGISLIASFAASVYDRNAFAAFFACAGGYALARAFDLARRGR